MTKYESEYNRNVDCMIKTDALHDHIRLLSGALAEKEINEEKLTTQQQQMKKLMTLLVPSTPSLTTAKKLNEKKVFLAVRGKSSATRSLPSVSLF